MRQGKPNICLGWMFDRSIAYMSDSNLILDSAWKAIEEAHGLPVLVTETLRLQVWLEATLVVISRSLILSPVSPIHHISALPKL